MRIFVAIELEKEIKENLSAFIQEMDSGNRNIRWVKRQGMHLTLKFLGETSEEKIAEVKSVLEVAASEHPSFELILKGTGTFPPEARTPRIIWIGIEENAALRAIHTRIENDLHKIRFPKEQRKFHPHLSLGRVKGPGNLGPVIQTLGQNRKTGFGRMIVGKITLFQSILKPTGAEYAILSEHNLQ